MESRRVSPSSRPAGRIAATKLVPPRAARQLVPREALIERLTESRRCRCVLIRGPAGSGKTSVLVAWRQVLLSLDFDVAWLSAAPEDNDASRFFDCLIASLALAAPAAVADASPLPGQLLDEPAIEHMVIALARGLAAHRREVMLMLDDLHHLDDPRVTLALHRLLDYAPDNLHLVFATRSAPAFSIARLKAQRRAVEFNLRDLLFSAAESEAFLRQRLDVIEPRDAAELHRLTDGWVAGLQLFAVDLKVRKATRYPSVPLRDADAFARYIETEVLARLTARDLDLLTRMAVCNRFCAQLCATLAGMPRAVAQMMIRLTGLEQNDLFLTQIPTGEREIWYRLHPLLREVLLLRLDRMPVAERNALHASAWHWFEDHGHLEEAVRHAVLAGETAAAANLVESVADEMMERGDYNQADTLLRLLPRHELDGGRIGLRISQARLLLYRGDVDRLSDSLDRLREDVDTGRFRADLRHRFDLTYLRAALALQREDFSEMRACLPRLGEAPESIGELQKAGIGNVIGWIHLCDRQYAAAREALARASRYDGSPQIKLVAECLAGLSHAQQGHVAEAEQCLHRALERSGVDAAFAMTSHIAACLLADLLYEQNVIDRVHELLDRRVHAIERTALPDAALFALRALGRIDRLSGRSPQAWDWLDRLEHYARRRGIDRLAAHALHARVEWHLQDANVASAAESLARLRQLAARHEAGDTAASREIAFLAAKSRIVRLHHEGRHEESVSALRTLLVDCEATARRREAVDLRLRLSVSLTRIADAASARHVLLRALTDAHRLGLLRTVLDASDQIVERLRALSADAGLDPIIEFYVKRLLQADRRAPDPARPVPACSPERSIEGLSQRERDVLMLLSHSMTNKRIAKALNVTAETVKWHLKNIYAKLEVSDRDEAVARLRDATLDRRRHG